MHEIRKINGIDELSKAKEMCYKAFGNNIDGGNSVDDSVKRIVDSPFNRSVSYWKETIIAEEKGNIFAQICPIPFNGFFNGEIAPMIGVGAVACIQKGTTAVKDCFSFLLKQKYDEQISFSYLFPFSGVYYGKLGYTYAYLKNIWTFSFANLRKIEKKNSIFSLQFEDVFEDKEKIFSIQKKFASNYCFSLVRDEIDWKNILVKGNFIIYNEHSYIIYKLNKDNALIYDWACDKPKKLLELLINIDEKIKNISITVPESFDITDIFEEMNLQKIPIIGKIESAGMARIVNVKKAFSYYKNDKIDDFKYYFSLSDSIIKKNEGVWCLKKEKGEISFERSNEGIQKSYNINQLTKLLIKGDGSKIFPYRKGGIFDGF